MAFAGWQSTEAGTSFSAETTGLTQRCPTRNPALGLGIRRVANFINGELVGSPTNGKWGVIFPKVDALPRHPSQLYEAVSHFLLLGMLLLLMKRQGSWARQKAGRLSLVFLSFYGFARFFTDFFRTDETYFGPLSSGQWASLALGPIGIGFLRFRVGQTQSSAQ